MYDSGIDYLCIIIIIQAITYTIIKYYKYKRVLFFSKNINTSILT